MKLFEVTVTHTLYVVAKSRDAAERVATSYEVRHEGCDDPEVWAQPITRAPDADIGGSIPWGVPESDPRRDWTVDQWAEAINTEKPTVTP